MNPSPSHVDTPELRKGRGAFFTPPEMSAFVVDWAVRKGSDSVLEPSCGEASFLIPAGERLHSLQRKSRAKKPIDVGGLHGVDVHRASAKEASRLLSEAGYSSDIRVHDFFDLAPTQLFDVVIGNPPYVRYQNFEGEAREKALRAALSQGVRLNQLASSWAAFTVHAARFLKPGGRLGLVLPAELLTVKYAQPVRRFLLDHFASIRLVMFEKLVFPGVLEEVVLLLAEGEGGTDKIEVYKADGLECLQKLEERRWSAFAPEFGDKWTPALLTAKSFNAYQRLVGAQSFCRLRDWGNTYLGSVTGNNGYFAVTEESVRELRLPESALLKISPPGSRHLRGLSFSSRAWKRSLESGAAGYLFYPPNARIGAAVKRYIQLGEAQDVHQAYKCRVRNPWWRVPLVPVADILFTYMNHDRPRLVSNGAKVHHLNSIYGISLKPELRKLGAPLLPIAALNSASLLGAEIVGRSYGGGLLKLEPREADLMPVPTPELLAQAAADLRALRKPVEQRLAENDLRSAVELVDQVLLRDHLQLKEGQIRSIRKAREVLFSRRTTRAKGKHGTR